MLLKEIVLSYRSSIKKSINGFWSLIHSVPRQAGGLFTKRNSMKKQVFISKSAKDTQSIGKDLALVIRRQGKRRRKHAVVINLSGELGAGKTNFAKGFAKGLGIKEMIASPTFVILKIYEIKNNILQRAGFKNFFHMDAYRIRDQKEMGAIGFVSMAQDPSNIIAVEWGENIKELIPKDVLRVEFGQTGRGSREITISQP
jgi:tRNA threonylcarbamoyladenosine biosynthesis protein TsaE